MLDREKVARALEAKRARFQAYLADAREQRQQTSQLVSTFAALSRAAVEEKLAAAMIQWPGALPTLDFDRAERLCIPFAQQWQNHQDARDWARSVLQGQPVLAVDGSQITPTKDLSIPVGAVQIGWFINEHNAAGRYVKDVAFEVLPPNELGEEADDEGGFPTWYVNQQRFVGECTTLCTLMEQYARRSDVKKPLCFFDGSFVISFAGQMRPERARAYVAGVIELLACSEQTQTPLIGFVDSSASHDLATLIGAITQGEVTVSDALLLDSFLPNWGDRSPFFICARPDVLSLERNATFYADVAFAYMRLTADRPPVRVEMPRWLLEAGRADELCDIVRAECVIGTGYPYAIETADAVAVISHQDRERFYALFQQFAQREGLDLALARKAQSKQHRR